MKTDWWRFTSQHMWRTFFALKRRQNQNQPMRESESKIYQACDNVFQNRFTQQDQSIIEMYFTTRWGDDLRAVEDYSLKNNVPVGIIWIVIDKAYRYAMEEIGLLDKKDQAEKES